MLVFDQSLSTKAKRRELLFSLVWLVVICVIIPHADTACTDSLCIACDVLITSQCTSCVAGNFVRTSDNTCQPCTLNHNAQCATCNQSDCLTCNSGYTITGISPFGCTICNNFMANCTECSSSIKCEACTFGYLPGPDPTGNKVQICLPDCSVTAYCSNCDPVTLYCTACVDSSFYVDTLSSPGTAPQCLQCAKAMPNCLTCLDYISCTSCPAGYSLQTGNPSPSCFDCTLISNCVSCSDGPNPVCINCITDAYFDFSQADNRCVLCSSLMNCATCADGPVCTACKPNFILDTSNSSKSCVPCSTILNCLSCDTGPVCTQCALGYSIDFSTGNRTCMICNFYKCLECTNGPVCTKCATGYYLDAVYKLCMPCSYPCVECNGTATNCTSCPTANTSFFFNSTAFNCTWCYHSIPFCANCTYDGTVCLRCISTLYYVDAAKQCSPCSGTCYECTSATQCLSCVSTSYAIQPLTKECLACSVLIPFCTTCLTPDVCLSCETTLPDPYFITYPPTACVTCQQAHPNCVTCQNVTNYGPGCTQCKPKFYKSTHVCLDCPFSCATCTDIAVCQTCINASYAVDNFMCKLCSELITNCSLCSSNTQCTHCINGSVKNTNGLGGCMLCTEIQYPDEPTQLCQPCEIPCKSCLNKVDCLTCRPFYSYVQKTKRCHDICGDSIAVTDQCDNGIGVKNDGCSDTCQQEDNFVCVLNPTVLLGENVKLSVCSYNQTLDIKLAHIVKEDWKNQLKFTYSIKPYLYGLPGTTLKDFTQDELKQIFVLYENNTRRLLTPSSTPGITVESVSTDPTNSVVNLTFSYDHAIKQSNIELYIDFQFLKGPLSLSNFVSTPDSAHLYQVSSYQSNSMIGQFYTEEQYSQASMLHKLATAISILSFLAFVVGIFTKEVVGLEMVMLCQFTYFSLFYFQGTLQLPFFALKGLIYSTGYNLPSTDLNFQILQQDPPQSYALSFDSRTFSNNFNLMTVLYILPLVLVIPFIPLKAKCIRKISMIELGHKWVDLFLGEIMFFCILFNFQSLLLGTIVFYRDGRNTSSYASSMMIWWGVLCTLCSCLGLIFKPEIYGNFRTMFKYDNELRREFIEEKKKKALSSKVVEKLAVSEQKMSLKKLILEFRLFMNENYFWKNHRQIHTVLTYNHYVIIVLFFTLSTIVLTLFKQSQLNIIALAAIVLVQQILMRPYSQVSQKLRAIFFFLVYIVVTAVRYINNYIINGEYNVMLSAMILIFLVIALVWTFAKIIGHFVSNITQQMTTQSILVGKIFKNDAADHLDKEKVAEEEEALMRKLMKRYQRVELQYNFNNVRNQLLQEDDDSIDQIKPKPENQTQKEQILPKSLKKNHQSKQAQIKLDILKKAEQSNNFKNLREEIEKEKKRKKKEEMRNKVTGTKMLQLLKLDNFNKYEKEFLMPEKRKKSSKKQQEESYLNQEEVTQKIQVVTPQQEQPSEQIQNTKDDYQSVQPQTLQEAQQKLEEEKVFMEQNQFIRYKRAMKIIANQGLDLDRDLIEQNYHHI